MKIPKQKIFRRGGGNGFPVWPNIYTLEARKTVTPRSGIAVAPPTSSNAATSILCNGNIGFVIYNWPGLDNKNESWKCTNMCVERFAFTVVQYRKHLGLEGLE